MHGDKQALALIQAHLKNELTAINQYFVHYRMLQHWGFEKLGKQTYKASIEAMKAADALMARLFLLEDLPNLQDLGKLFIGEDVPELLACDLKLETLKQQSLKAAIAHCESVRDYVSRDLLQELLEDNEEHIDWLDNQIDLIEQLGLPNYLQSQMGDAEGH